jgi:uncharacterized protein with PIN domain
MVYQCPKHPGVISNNAGRCNKCNAVLNTLTMDEAIENLSGKGKKKPELKSKRINSVEEEKVETLNSSEIAESAEIISEESEEDKPKEVDLKSWSRTPAEHAAIILLTDKDKDGMIYQCSKCFEKLSDTPEYCKKCKKNYLRITVEKAQKNIPDGNH